MFFFTEFVYHFGMSCNDFVADFVVAMVSYLIDVACLLGVLSVVDYVAVVF